MKATITILSLLLVATVGGLGYGYYMYDKQSKELQGVCESRDALARRAAILEHELQKLNDNASRNKLAPLIAAVKTSQALVAAHGKIKAATTSLAKEPAQNEYTKLVESSKGRRVVFTGTIKDIGKRLISFSQMYLTLTVDEGFNVKFIFEKESESQLLALKAGQKIILEGYVVSTGDLMHDLTVGGPATLDQKIYDKAVRLGGAK